MRTLKFKALKPFTVMARKSLNSVEGKNRRPPIDREAYELRIQAAITGVSTGLYKSFLQAAKEQQVSRQTLHDRAKGLHKPKTQAHSSLQLLTPEEEKVIIDWCEHRPRLATPICAKSIRAKVFSITGKHPGKNWHHRFLSRHPTLVLSKPSDPDPKRAANLKNPNASGDGDSAPSMASSAVETQSTSCPDQVPTSLTAVNSDSSDSESLTESDAMRDGGDEIEGSQEREDMDIEVEMAGTPTRVQTNIHTPARSSAATPALSAARWTLGSVSSIANTPITQPSLVAEPARNAPSRSIDSIAEEQQRGHDRVVHELGLLRQQMAALTGVVEAQTSQISATNARYMLMHQELSDLRMELANLGKRKAQGSTKPKVTHPRQNEAIETEEREQQEGEACDAENASETTAEEAARATCIAEGTQSTVFSGSLASYKRKPDLIAIASALSLLTDGTVANLTLRIKTHLSAHPDLINVPRFTGLYGGRSRIQSLSPPSTSLVVFESSPVLPPPIFFHHHFNSNNVPPVSDTPVN